MIKNIIKIILVVIILAGLGIGVYWFFDRQQGGTGSILTNNNISVGDFFPFGQGNDNTNTPVVQNPINQDPVEETQTDRPSPRIWRISQNPQSGAIAFNNNGSAVARFVDKATGNVFESALFFLGFSRVSNTTIPKVYEALWQQDGGMVVLRYLNETNDVIRSTYGMFSTTTSVIDNGEGEEVTELLELQGKPLPDNIRDLAINPSNGQMAYLVESRNNSAIYVTDKNVTSTAKIFESPIKDFEIDWVDNETLSLLTKPNATTEGFLYFLDIESGLQSRVLGNKLALIATVNPEATKVVYSENKSGNVTSGIFDIETGQSVSLPIVAIPEKCVWSETNPYLYCATPTSNPGSGFPDNWYKGQVSFSDSIWRIDTSNLSTELLVDPTFVATEGLDIINPALDPNENFLIFTNKKDSQLWGFRVNEAS